MPSSTLLHATWAYAYYLTHCASRRVAAFPRRQRGRDDRGQTTAEYGLVILAAGTLALAAILWARSSGSITSLFETVINTLTGDI